MLPLAARTLQIFNIETKQRIKSHQNHEDIVFWKWVSETTIGIVTETSVYHWTISDQTSPPQKIFDLHPTLAGTQIINYRGTPDENWLVLICISSNTTNPSAFKIKGSMQLYNRERGVSQLIEGHAASFSEIKLVGHQKPTKLFAFAVRTATGAKVYYLLMMKVFIDPELYSCKLSRSTIIHLTHHSPRRTWMSISSRRQQTIFQSPCKFRRNMESFTSSLNMASFTSMTSNPVSVST